MSKFDQIIKKILLFSPLIFLIYTPWTLYPSIFGRTIIFQILIEVILIILIITVLLARHLSLRAKRSNLGEGIATSRFSGTRNDRTDSRIKQIFYSPIGLALVFFTLVQFISFLFSVDREQSFWGSMSRMDGIFSWLHFVAFFFLLIFFFKNGDWKIFFIVNSIVAGILSVLAIIQRYHDLIPKYILQSGRVYATFGNPVFFALYILFSIFIGIFLLTEYAHSQTAARRWLAQSLVAVSIILQMIALYFTNSQGALLGFLVGFVVGAMLFATWRLKKIHYKIALWIAVCIVATAALLTTHQGRALLSGNIDQVEGLSARFVVWKMGIQGWLERPVIGFGPSTFEYVFDKYYHPELLHFSFYETVSNKPHNIVVEILDHNGILGLLSYLGIFLASFYSLWKLRNTEHRVSIVGAGLLVAYFIVLQFAFDTTNSLFMFMVFLAYLTYLTKEQKNKRTKEQESIEISYPLLENDATCALRRNNKFVFVFSCSSVLVIAAAFWFGNVEAWAASIPAARSENSYWYQKPIKWGDEVRRSLTLRTPYHDEIRVILAQDLLAWEASGSLAIEDALDMIYPMRRSLIQSTEEHRQNFQYYFMLGQVESILGQHVDTANFNRARTAIETALTISPKRQAAYLILGRILIGEGKLDEAESVISKSLELYEKNGISYWFLGLAKVLNGKPKDGVAEFWRAHDFGYDFAPNEFSYWLSVNERLGYREDSIKLYIILAKRFPLQRGKFYSHVHTLYTELGDEAQASFFKRFSELENKDKDGGGLTVSELYELIEANTRVENYDRNGDLYKQLMDLVPDQRESIANEAVDYFSTYGNQGWAATFRRLTR